MVCLHPRWLMIALVAASFSGILAPSRAAAQESGRDVEALALQAHVQNLRTGSYTAWIGGPLGDPARAPARTAVGQSLSTWTLTGMAGDEAVGAGDLTRPVLLNFWASWCPPCRLEFPHLVEVALAPQAHSFDVRFVNAADSDADARAFLADYPAAIHTVLDAGDRLGALAGIQSLPTSLLLDADGTVLAVHVGILTPTLTRFLDAAAAQPGAGHFTAADHPDVEPIAILAPIDPDNTPVLQPAQPVSGTITDDDFQDAYRIEGHAGDGIEASLSAAPGGLLDTYLVLMAEDGTRLAENDDIDSGVITDSTIHATLPADGDYLLVVTRFLEAEGFSTGDYRLVVDIAAVSAPDSPAAPGDDGWTQRVGDGFIGYNRTVSASVSGRNPQQLFAFEGRAGDVVTLRLSHDPGTTMQIEVKDTHLQRFALSEWSDEAGTTSLENLVLPEDGYYRISVARPRSRDAAETWFALALEAPDYAAPPPVTSGEATLAYGETVGGRLDDERYEQHWVFAGERGDVVTLTMERLEDMPGGLDGYLMVVGPDGATLIELDDTAENVMPHIEGLTLPTTGTYTVIATRFGFAHGLSVGDYTLRLERAGVPRPAEAAPAPLPGTRWLSAGVLPAGLQRLTAAEPAMGWLDADHVDDWYIFRGEAGERVTLRMQRRSGDLDPLLILTDETGYELVRNDDASASTVNAAIETFALPSTGAYLVRATRYGFEHGPSAGDYRLTLAGVGGDSLASASETPTLTFSAPITGTLAIGAPDHRYRFEASAGDRVTVVVQRQSGDVNPALSLRAPDGREIAANRDWLDASTARLAGVRLPVDGTYLLDVLLDDLSTAGDYRLIVLPTPSRALDAGAFMPAPGADLEVVLVWSSPADLDLAVQAPDTPGPAVLTHHAHDFCAETQPAPIERAVWEGEPAAPGIYRIVVRYSLNCGVQTDAVGFLLGVAADGIVVDLIGGELAREGDSYTTLLEYPPR